MNDLSRLGSLDLLTLGHEALRLSASRFEAIAEAADPADLPLRELLGVMALDTRLQADALEHQSNFLPGNPRASLDGEGVKSFLRAHLPTLWKSLGEGFLHRDIALFLSESLEEEISRFCRVLGGHAREARSGELFTDFARRELSNVHYLREVVLQG